MYSNKKYKITDETLEWDWSDKLNDGFKFVSNRNRNVILHRIVALKDFKLVDGREIHKGDKGGWIEKEENLSQEGHCWVADEGKVFMSALVRNNAIVYENAQVFGSENKNCCGFALIEGNAKIFGYATIVNADHILRQKTIISDNAEIFGKACVFDFHGSSSVYDNAKIFGHAFIQTSDVFGNAKVYDYAGVEDTKIYGNAKVFGNARLDDGMEVFDNAKVYDNVYLSWGKVFEEANVFGDFCTISKDRFDIFGDAKIFDKNSFRDFIESNNGIKISKVNKSDGDTVSGKVKYDSSEWFALRNLLKNTENKKFELLRGTERKLSDGTVVYRVGALKDFTLVNGIEIKKGDKGGWVEKEKNLSQAGSCWVADEALVIGDAKVFGNAIVSGNSNVYNSAEIFGDAKVLDNSNVYNFVKVFDNAQVSGDASVMGNAEVFGDAKVMNNVRIFDNAKVYGKAFLCDDAKVYGGSHVYGNAIVKDRVHVFDISSICGNACLSDCVMVHGNVCVFGNTEIFGNVHIFYDNNDKSNVSTIRDKKSLQNFIESHNELRNIDHEDEIFWENIVTRESKFKGRGL